MSQDTATAHTQTITRSAQIHASATSGYVPAPSWAGGVGPFVVRSLDRSATLTLLTLPRRGDPKPAPKPRKRERRSPRHTQRRKK